MKEKVTSFQKFIGAVSMLILGVSSWILIKVIDLGEFKAAAVATFSNQVIRDNNQDTYMARFSVDAGVAKKEADDAKMDVMYIYAVLPEEIRLKLPLLK